MDNPLQELTPPATVAAAEVQRAVQAKADISIIEWTAAVLVGLAIIVWLIGWWLSRRPGWPLRIHRVYRRWPWVLAGAFGIAAMVIGISIGLAILLMKEYGFADAQTSGLLASPGIAAALAGGVATVMTFLMAQIVRAQQEAQIPTSGWLLDEAATVITDRIKGVVDKKRGKDPVVELYMLDYSPAIGSRPYPNEHKWFKSRIMLVASNPMFDVHLLFSSDRFLESYYADMGDREDSSSARDLIASLAKLRPVWRSDDIGQMHLIIIGDVAFQYVVLPFGSASRAAGIKTEDAFQVAFLKDTVKHSLRSAITPEVQRDPATGGCTLTLRTPQPDGDTALKIELYEDKNFEDKKSPSTGVRSVERNLSAGDSIVTLTATDIGSAKYLRVTATKQKMLLVGGDDVSQSQVSLVREIPPQVPSTALPATSEPAPPAKATPEDSGSAGSPPR